MNLDLFDAYNIRARLCPSIILLSPIAVTMFFCFKDIFTVASSSFVIFVLLAFTNYIPILQRTLQCKKKKKHTNYAAQLLYTTDDTIDPISKERYYRKLAEIDDSFALFRTPDDNPEFQSCCSSAVVYLRNQTRDNHLVQEENINHGFIRGLLANKPLGIALCISLLLLICGHCFACFHNINEVPDNLLFVIIYNGLMGIFWAVGVTEDIASHTAKKYAKALIEAIDSLA